jgi:N-acetyl-anhydromuramyl-L-alanine amidase AmpD
MAPTPEVTRNVRNQSSRHGAKPVLIVLHDTEGANVPGIRDLQGLGDWFDNPKAQASSHSANDAEGNDARFVPDSQKAWHVAGFNSVSLGIEQIGFATQKVWPKAQLQNTAEWIAYWSHLHDIPIRRGEVSGTRVVKPGVVMHSELGTFGGGHHDPGNNYPLALVITMALGIAPPVVSTAKTLTTLRAKLRSLLALRARLRQDRAEIDAKYAVSEKDFNVTRDRIKRLQGKK